VDLQRLMRRAPCCAGLVAFAVGCGVEEWRNADLQLDVSSDLPDTAEQVRVCVDGAGVRELGAAAVGRFAVPGVPTDRPAIVTVQVLAAGSEDTALSDSGGQVIGQAGPVTLEADAPYASTAYNDYTGGASPALCEVSGSFAGEEEESWLLAVRFTD